MVLVLRALGGVMAGAAAGYVVSRFVCTSGACPITSNRYLMVLTGAVTGLMLMLHGCSGASATRAPGGPAEAGTVTTAAEFEQRVLQADTPVVVDFYADWCGPCRQLAPILQRLEKDYAGRIAFVRVDVDRAGELARTHDIESIPTLVFYRAGTEAGRIVGLAPEPALRQRLDGLLARQ